MKDSKFKNFISAINPKTKKESVTTNEDEYTEVVSGAETISPSNHIMRIVSSLTAAAVLATGIGVTSFMIYKGDTNRSTLSEKEVVSVELTDSADTVAVAPFADFKQICFELYVLNNCNFVEYSDETYDKLAEFLNSSNWGEETSITESEIPDFDNYEGKGYLINWRKGDVWFYVYVTEEGKAYYKAEKCDPQGNWFYYPVIECSAFNIDYEVFDKGIQDIWSSYVPDTDKYLSKHDKMYLTQGEFRFGMVEHCEGYDYEAVIPEWHQSFKALQGFLRDDLVDMFQKDNSISYDSDDLRYTVACYYKTSNTTTRRLTYYISGNGVANLCEYELTDNAEIPTGCSNYYIDINEFEAVLNDILSGKYDDKYSFVVTTTTAAAVDTATTMTTAEQVDAPDKENEEETAEKVPVAEDTTIPAQVETMPETTTTTVSTADKEQELETTATTAISEEPVITSAAVTDPQTQVEYDNAPMVAGETRQIHFYNPETKTAKKAEITEISDNISVQYDEGNDTLTIKATESGEAKLYICCDDCAFGAYVNIKVISAEMIKGDVNCDGQVDFSDVVIIMQALANPDKYGIDGTAEHHLTEQGKLNGDMDGDGLTVGDAQAIQRKLLGLDTEK